MDARLETIFREETRRALGGERMTAERLMQLIIDFPATAPPEELAVFAYGIQQLAAGMARTAAPVQTTPEEATAAVSGAVAALTAFRQEPATPLVPRADREARDTSGPPPPGAPRPAAAPFRVTYPAPATRPRAVAPPLAEATELDPPSDDIEDFTASATAS
jgi:hypothetical protein